ncbi:MAG: 5-(carboxyamino)imidazole ribonucleotide synthase [Planctomycetota bacterium]
MIPPGATIGMVGGGQLGRMFAIAAAQMGYRVSVFCGSSDEPAAQVATTTVCGPLSDYSAVEAFAKTCDVITLEFENIPAETIALCSKFAPTYPSATVLAISQDRGVEKRTLAEAGLDVTPHRLVSDSDSAIAAADELGWPLIVKTCRSGYDGKGQYRLTCPSDAASVQWEFDGGWIAEAMMDFDLEVSVIAARTADGRISTFPVFENHHANHILVTTHLPAMIEPGVEDRARQIAEKAAAAVDVVGLLCVEMFVCGDEIRINEIAPRPHNSGHVTLDACATSQFQQHVRAICGLPLGQTKLTCSAAGMANLLGDIWLATEGSPHWDAAMTVPGVNVHLYGKHAAPSGRKMGHLNTVGADRSEVVRRLTQAHDLLSRGAMKLESSPT